MKGKNNFLVLVATIIIVAVAVISFLLSSTSRQRAHRPVVMTPTGFVGTWQVHGGVLTIGRHLTGSIVYQDPPGQDTVGLVLSRNSEQTSIRVVVKNDLRVLGGPGLVMVPNPPGRLAPGDTFNFVQLNPTLLKMTAIRTRYPNVIGNPYWCAPTAMVTVCGA